MPETPTINDTGTGNDVERVVVSNTNVRVGSLQNRRNKRSRAANQEDLGKLEILNTIRLYESVLMA